jgi:hypothetical protein
MKGSKYGEEARASAITLAQAKGTKTASAETGIPERTIGDWLSDPRYAELRAKTRDDIAEQSKVIAQLAGGEIASRIRAGGFKDTALAAWPSAWRSTSSSSSLARRPDRGPRSGPRAIRRGTA